MWLLWLWGAIAVYGKLAQCGFYRFDICDFAYYFFVFMVVKNIFFIVVYRVLAFMRTRDWLKQRQWENRKREMEQHIYTQKYQDFLKYQEFLKQQELSNSNEIKEINYECAKGSA